MKKASVLAAAILATSMLVGIQPLAAGHTQPGGMGAGKMMTKDMKADGDGMVSKDEYMKRMTEMWEKMDKEKKGKVKMSDLERAFNTGMAGN